MADNANKLIKNARSNIMRNYIKSASVYRDDSFTQILEEAIKNLLEKIGSIADFESRTGALFDSIGALMLVNGSDFGGHWRYYLDEYSNHKTKDGYTLTHGTHKGWKKHDIPPDTGRGYLETYFDEVVRQNKGTHGIRVYVCAAAYYGQFLEDGSYAKNGNGRKYHVISFADDLLEAMLGEVARVWNGRNGQLGSRKGGVRNFVVKKVGTAYGISGTTYSSYGAD